MNINPEFKRNLWLELTRERLFAMPIILIALFWISYLQHGFANIPNWGLALLFILLVIWGSGLSGDSVFSEVRDHTWDQQRMTPLGPWSMTWGKLFGSTIFVWYGALFCVLAIVTVMVLKAVNVTPLRFHIVYYLLAGLAIQAFTLLLALLFQGISSIHTRARVVLIQLFSIFFGSFFFYVGLLILPIILKDHHWYHLNIPPKVFIIISLISIIGWFILGVYRLIGRELKIKSISWAYPLFTLFFIFYLLGYITTFNGISANGLFPKITKPALYLGLGFIVSVKLTFLAAFFAPKNIVSFLRFNNYVKQRQYFNFLSVIPSWVMTALIALLFLIPLIYFLKQGNLQSTTDPDPDIYYRFIGFSISVFLFLLRDISIIYYLTLQPKAKRAHLAAIVYLIVLYTLLPILLSLVGFPSYWMPAISPWYWFFPIGIINFTHIIVINIIILLQFFFGLVLIRSIWNKFQKKIN